MIQSKSMLLEGGSTVPAEPNRGPSVLRQHAGRLPTAVGGAFPGTHAIFRGHDLHRDLGGLDWVDLYAFGITGRRLKPEQIEMLHGIWVNTSYPDARLWNNRAAALAANSRSSPTMGMVAALAISEATVYGGQAGLWALDFLQQALIRVQDGEDLERLVLKHAREHRIHGYGRPINSTDERLPWLMALAAKLGLANGPHVTLAFEVEKVLLRHYPKLRMNYAALHAALVSDMGLSAQEYQLLRIPTFMAGIAPCFVEAAEKPEGALFATSCDAVRYHGHPLRKWR
ncbi:hypothetical protein LPN04_29640 [Rugamonas sp. A1-17]|nr:hypothetical protein [Rugamonas sp. A1-17]